MNKNWVINGYELSDNEQKLFYAGLGLSAVILFFMLLMFAVYIYYSWIRKTNSANLTGRTLTEKIFKQNNKEVAVVDSFFYAKYWNYNKKRGTHKLRPWTSNRSSIWTMMEASQQAYATVIREAKSKQFWLLFRLPFIIRFAGTIIGVLIMALGLSIFGNGEIDPKSINIPTFTIGLTIMSIAYIIADVGKIYTLWKNIIPLLNNSGLSESEIKEIKKIFFLRMILAIAVVIIEMIKLFIRIALEFSKKSNQK